MMHARASLGGFFPLSVSLLLAACSSGDTTKESQEEPTNAAKQALISGDLALTAPRHIGGTMDIPASLAVRTTVDGCNNRGGPNITLEGTFTVAEGLPATIRAQNNVKGTHVAEETARVDILLTDVTPYVFPKKNVTGNPVIFVQIVDDHDHPIGEPISIGRCNGAGKTIDSRFDFVIPGRFDADIGPGGCDNSGGPFVTIDGGVVLGGFHAKLILGNKPLKKFDTADANLLITLSPGETVTFHKQPSLGGAGGNPLLYVDLCGAEFFLGRCKGGG